MSTTLQFKKNDTYLFEFSSSSPLYKYIKTSHSEGWEPISVSDIQYAIDGLCEDSALAERRINVAKRVLEKAKFYEDAWDAANDIEEMEEVIKENQMNIDYLHIIRLLIIECGEHDKIYIRHY